MDLNLLGQKAKQSSFVLASLSTAKKNEAINRIADILEASIPEILEANAEDLAEARAGGISEAMLDRLTLNEKRVRDILNDMRKVVLLDDPVGSEFDSRVLPNGLKLLKRRVPLGVIGVIYEARPNVTVDITSLCLKTGNACILRGGRETFNTNKVTVAQSAAKVIVGEAGYATYYKSNKAYVMPTGMNGYVFNLPGGLGEIAYAAGETVEAGRALVLEAAAGTYDLVFTDPVAPKDLASQLHGSDAAGMTDVILPGSYVYYGLSLAQGDDPATVGFYYMATDGAAFENGAHKAFLALPAGTPAPERILFHNNDATNIENVEGQEKAVKFIQNGQIFIRKDGVVYDAMGRVIR